MQARNPDTDRGYDSWADLADDPSTRLISVRVEPLWRQL